MEKHGINLTYRERENADIKFRNREMRKKKAKGLLKSDQHIEEAIRQLSYLSITMGINEVEDRLVLTRVLFHLQNRHPKIYERTVLQLLKENAVT